MRVTGYWDVFIDGDVAAHTYGAGFQADSTALTRQANAVIQSVAQNQGATYVDLFTPLKGPAGGGDPTSMLAADSDHPNQAVHQEIADTLALAGNAPLHTAASCFRRSASPQQATPIMACTHRTAAEESA